MPAQPLVRRPIFSSVGDEDDDESEASCSTADGVCETKGKRGRSVGELRSK
jgi:hypothetical protein